MLDLNDGGWKELEGGYRIKYDASIPLSKLETSNEPLAPIWSELWQELHHQGDVGIASYASMPHIARIVRRKAIFNWNPFALAVTVELARGKGQNPEVPDWLIDDYNLALHNLANYAVEKFNQDWDADLLQSVLSLIAIVKGSRNLGELIAQVSESEAKIALEKFFDS